jgi:SAM-dependent methyltransferase
MTMTNEKNEIDKDTKPLTSSKRYEGLKGQTIELMNSPHVWPPYSAGYFLKTLEASGLTDNLEGKRGIDIGCGGGILGFALLSLEMEHMLFCDISPYAVDLVKTNGRWNYESHMFKEGENFNAIQSDVLKNIPADYKVDIEVFNAPMNPIQKGTHEDNLAFKSNQNYRGRQALDDGIAESRAHLNPGGGFVATASSRQGFDQTIAQFNKYYGDSWRILNYGADGKPGIDQALDPEYHYPFFDSWALATLASHSLYIYQRDTNGKPFFEWQVSEGLVKKYITVERDGNEELILVTINGDKIPKFYELKPGEEPNRIYDVPPEVANTTAADETYYHRYYMIAAVNTVDEASE